MNTGEILAPIVAPAAFAECLAQMDEKLYRSDLFFVKEGPDEEATTMAFYTVGHSETAYSVGLLGWDVKEECPMYVGYWQQMADRCEKEGIPEEDCAAWIDVKTPENFVKWLAGDISFAKGHKS